MNGVTRVDILARGSQHPVPGSIAVANKNDAAAKKDSLTEDQNMGNLFVGKLTKLPGKPDKELTLSFDTKAMADLWIAVAWN